MLQKIWLVRHGERLDFVQPEWFNTAIKRYDPPLSDNGVIQAQDLAQKLKLSNIKYIFCSPFLRTIQTAYEIAKELNLLINIEAGLGEWLNADWMSELPEIHYLEELKINYPLLNCNYESFIFPQYPETEINLKNRCYETINFITQQYTEDLLIIGHKDSIKQCALQLVGDNFAANLSFACLLEIVRDNQQWKLMSMT